MQGGDAEALCRPERSEFDSICRLIHASAGGEFQTKLTAAVQIARTRRISELNAIVASMLNVFEIAWRLQTVQSEQVEIAAKRQRLADHVLQAASALVFLFVEPGNIRR